MDRRVKKPGQRPLRVGEQIRHILVEHLQRGSFRDPVLADAAAITVSEVSVSPDLRNATCYVLPLGGRDTTEVIAALNRAAGHFKGELGRHLHTKVVPSLSFRADESFDAADRINQLLAQPQVARDLPPSSEDDQR